MLPHNIFIITQLKILHDLIKKKKGDLCRNFILRIRKIKKINVENFNGLK